MNITAATLARLEVGSNYYLSNTTGTIKKANLWQWIKCFTGLGDGRAKAQRLAEVVKASLLANAELKQDDALSADIKQLDTNHSLSGATLRDIATRFKMAHADAISAVDARNEAHRIAEQVINGKVAEWVDVGRVLATPENLVYIRKIALYSVQHLLAEAYDKHEVPSNLADRMRRALVNTIEAINTAEFMQSAQRSKLGFPSTKENAKGHRPLGVPRFQLDELHFRAILAALITKDGPVRLADFTNKLAFFHEVTLQERKNALLNTRLEPPDTLKSGFIFADKATTLYRAMQDSEWFRNSME